MVVWLAEKKVEYLVVGLVACWVVTLVEKKAERMVEQKVGK